MITYIRNRDTLLAMMPKHGKVAEVGVWHGAYAKSIRTVMEPSELYLVDLWGVQAGGVYDDAINNEKAMDDAYRATRIKFDHIDDILICRMSSLDAALRMPREYLDFVYIDANHSYEAARADLFAWAPTVKPGGYLCGHDYFDGEAPRPSVGVRQAVEEYLAASGRSIEIMTCEPDAAHSYAIRM